MSRDQRVEDNWALLHAQEQAIQRRVSLVVVFCLVPGFVHAGRRQYEFMLTGLRQVESNVRGNSPSPSPCCMAIRPKRSWPLSPPWGPLFWWPISTRSGSNRAGGPQWRSVSAFPLQRWTRTTSSRAVRSRTSRSTRPALSGLRYTGCCTSSWSLFLSLNLIPTRFPRLPPSRDWSRAQATANAAGSAPPVDWPHPGASAAQETLAHFIRKRLPRYAQARNDPNADGCSGLSPYLHFGHISAQRVALETVGAQGAGRENKDAFLEELIVRRELSDNFCLHNPDHDRYWGIPPWGRKTLEKHSHDPRPFLYSLDEFEWARTHSPLWNAAQTELVRRGKMHGYMRMFWAKKILEWSESPSQAVEIALYLNDRYELDGRDPNGCVGVLWSIGGLHDRPWGERPVFGTIRSMTESGCRRKFDTGKYIGQWT